MTRCLIARRTALIMDAVFLGLNGLSRLIVSFAVLLITYTAVLWMTRETTFVRVSRSVHMAIG